MKTKYLIYDNSNIDKSISIPELDQFHLKYPKVKIHISFWDYQNYDEINDVIMEYAIEIDHIIIPKKDRNKGIGSKILSIITKYADKKKYLTFLQVDDVFGGDYKRLVNFYKRFGFIKRKFVNGNVTNIMTRNPKLSNNK